MVFFSGWDLFQLVGHDGRFVSVFLASSSFGQGYIKTYTRGISPYLTLLRSLSYFYAPCCCLFSFCLVVKLFAHISTLMCISLNGNHLEALRQSLFIYPVVVGQSWGSRQAVVRQTSGSRQSVISQTSDSGQAVFMQLPGSRRAVVRQSSGSHQAVVRQSSGSRQAVVKELFGSQWIVIYCAAYMTEIPTSKWIITFSSRHQVFSFIFSVTGCCSYDEHILPFYLKC